MQKFKTAKNLNSIKRLADSGLISAEKIPMLEKVAQKFSVAITPQMAELLSPSHQSEFPSQSEFASQNGSASQHQDYSSDPLTLQFIPSEKELEIKSHQLNDPIGDHVHSPVKGVVHRHPDRCLLKVIHTCPVYCRFCFRREQIGHQEKMLNDNELETAYQYIESQPEIWEVILTGGDPLMLNPKKMAQILGRLTAIKTVEVIRIHSRVPVVDSKRINAEMIQALSSEKALFIVLHANHPKEFTQEAETAIQNIIRAGIPMLSQSVLLKGVNDDAITLQTLLKTFVKNRIKPYYLHHCDLAKGTDHFRTTIEEGQTLVDGLRRNISGLCQPIYVLDIPGGHGKVPLHPHYIHRTDHTTHNLPHNLNDAVTGSITDSNSTKNERYILEDFLGGLHIYPPIPKKD